MTNRSFAFAVLLLSSSASAQVAPEIVALCAKEQECDGTDAAACETANQDALTRSASTGAALCLDLNTTFLAQAACIGALTCEERDGADACSSERAAFSAIAEDALPFCADGTAPPNVPGWHCPLAFYGTGDGCDCGCGVDDPDCDGGALPCEFCHDEEGNILETCADARCAGHENSAGCEGATQVSCEEGVVVDTFDCLTRGEVCLDGACILAAPACGPLGIGECNGTVASICEGGQLSTTVDCTTLGRRCGATPEGDIGCITGGGGEGEGEGEEGEGEPECVDDSDCDDDEECDDGQCESAGGGRDRGGDDVIEPAPLFACASATPGAVGLSVVALALLRRRRR
jgi:hypothetical protein